MIFDGSQKVIGKGAQAEVWPDILSLGISEDDFFDAVKVLRDSQLSL